MRPPVLLIPPTAADASTWGTYAEHLRAACQVITYNREAGRPLDEQAAQAAAVIVSESPGPAVVAGVSLGATVALRLAADHPDLVAALHLHETPFHAKKHPNLETIRAVIRMQRTAKHGHPAEAAAGFVRWAYTRTDGDSAYDEWPQQWRDVALTDPAGVLSDVGIATGESIRKSDLTRVTMPTLCTAGTLTRPYNRSLMRRLASALPDATYAEIPDAGHGATFEQPELMAEQTRKIAESELGARHA